MYAGCVLLSKEQIPDPEEYIHTSASAQTSSPRQHGDGEMKLETSDTEINTDSLNKRLPISFFQWEYKVFQFRFGFQPHS